MMQNGLLLVGLNGCGKSTLARLLAPFLALRRMDVEDYYFPSEQSVPYTTARTRAEVEQLLVRDIGHTRGFVLCSVKADWCPAIVARLALAVVLEAPAPTRMERIVRREQERFGDRVLPGGDMEQQQKRFRAFAASRQFSEVEASLAGLTCPIRHVDATLPPAQLCQMIADWYRAAL